MSQIIPKAITDADDTAKYSFALALLKTNDQFEAGRNAFPLDFAAASHASMYWPHDAKVKEIMANIQAEDPEAATPDKSEFVTLIRNRMKSPHTTNDDFAKLGKLYISVMGWEQKPMIVNNNTNNSITNKVMLIRDVPKDEWETNAERQQRELLNVSTSRH